MNPLVTRYSPIYNATYESLKNLNASFVRLQLWFPYPKFSVAQLNPPSGKYLCTHLNGDSNNNNWTAILKCPQGTFFLFFCEFAKYALMAILRKTKSKQKKVKNKTKR